MLTGKPLFPGKSIVHQLDLITDLLGTPPSEIIAGVWTTLLFYYTILILTWFFMLFMCTNYSNVSLFDLIQILYRFEMRRQGST